MEAYKALIEQLPLEQQLSIEQEQFRGAFETSAIGMAIVGLDGRWLKVNDSLLHIVGYTHDELCKLTFQDITHPDDLDADLELVNQLLDNKKDSYQMEKRYYRKNGEIAWVILSVSMVRDTLGRPLHFVSQITDISEIKKITHLRLAETDKYTSRIALELHENIAQALASIKMYLNSSHAAKMYNDRNLHSVDQQLSSLIAEIKGLTGNIMPTTFLGQDLKVVIEDLALKYHVQHNIFINMDIDEKLQELSFHSSYHIFRIIEDHLKLAVIRNATVFSLGIVCSATINIEIDDDGQSTSLSAKQEELLFNDIKTRIEILNGASRNISNERSVQHYCIPSPAGEQVRS